MNTTLITLYLFLLGSVIGSFLNVCILRLPAGESLVKPRSHCPKCGTTIPWYYNIPIVSYLVLRGKCASCGERISPLYPIVEGITGLAAVASFLLHGLTPSALRLFIFSSLLIVAILTDAREKILPDEITLGGLLAGILFAAFNIKVTLLSALWGSVVGAGLFLTVLMAYYLLKGFHGMGFGDVKMMAFLGAFVGFPSVIHVVVSASFLGILFAVILMIWWGKDSKFALPFGSFLGAAALILAYLPPSLLYDLHI